ncbi:hypothetical protein [Intrasporangium calvum]|uniref:hypothetical protein n=1 Tax=Intrasporangium calvum TaxID=53358 RepID=UPI000DF5C903|nr:hypothetical protein [Intrasporangium calvum]AXG12182.1 hypothetical protein DN585_00885 [Intrasporangium calvum]
MAVGLEIVLTRGVAEGVITGEQAERLRHLGEDGTGPVLGEGAWQSPTRRGPSLVTEALGYLGGIILLVGAILIGSQYWPDVDPLVRLGVVVLVAVAFVVAGSLMPRGLDAVGTRLRSVLWALSVAAGTGAAAILLYDVVDVDDDYVPALMFLLATVYALALWAWRPTGLQLAVAAAGTAVTAGLLVNLLVESWNAVIAGVLVVGVVWLALGWAAVIRPPRAALVVGAGIVFVGSQMYVVGGSGPIWAVLASAGLVGVALYHRDLIILGVGALGLLFALPNLIYEWFPSVVAAAVSLLVVGGLLVVAALYTARRGRQHPGDGPAKGPANGAAGSPANGPATTPAGQER